MNTVRSIFLAASLLAANLAGAQLETLVLAVETAPSNMILPSSMNGMMTFRPCADACEEEYVRVQMTPETTFSVDNRAVKFEEFKAQLATVKLSQTSYGLVSYETKTNKLMSVSITR